jgi:hypothetical protein
MLLNPVKRGTLGAETLWHSVSFYYLLQTSFTAMCTHSLLIARCNTHSLCTHVLLLAVPQQRHYEGSDVSDLLGRAPLDRLTVAALAAGVASRLQSPAPSVYRGAGMQPPVARGDSYRDDIYAGSYTGGGYAAGSAVRSSRCVLFRYYNQRVTCYVCLLQL